MSSVKKHTSSLTPRSFKMPLQSRQEVSERCLQSFMEVSRYMSRYTCDARKSAGWVDDSLYAIVATRSSCQASGTPSLDTYACRSAATIVYLSQPLVSVCWSFEETRIRPEGVVVEE
jgi:hypothetical protein